MVHIGIDLGTSNTVVAFTNPSGAPEVLSIRAGESLIPTVLNVKETGGARTVGALAVDEWADPDFDQSGSFRRWKLDMGEGRTIREMRFGGPSSNPKLITPEQLTTWLVEDVLAQVSSGSGGVDVESVLVTVPHGWRRDRPEKCRATRLAAGRAIVQDRLVPVQSLTVSEPVAAAVYWLWEARQSGESAADYSDKTIAVVDVGGGTFDLSLVRVGSHEDDPLVVIDAVNSDYAGDFATALVLSAVVALYNREYGAEVTTDPNELLARIGSDTYLWLRSWFLQSQRLVHDLSSTISAGRQAGRAVTRARSASFEDSRGNEFTFRMTPQQLEDCLVPFYESGRELVKRFLSNHGRDSLPYAVVFAGGGSRIAGVHDHIMGRALREVSPDGAEEVLNRIAMNERVIDRAVALGAALVANGIVKVQERLLCDIGIVTNVTAPLSRHLRLGDQDTEIVLTPVLGRGRELPASFSTADYSELPPLAVAPGEDMSVEVVVFDDPEDPWVQLWEIPHPADGQHTLLEVEMSADTDGVLGVTFRPVGKPEVSLAGRLSRNRTGHAKLLWTVDRMDGNVRRAVTIEQLVAARKAHLVDLRARGKGSG